MNDPPRSTSRRRGVAAAIGAVLLTTLTAACNAVIGPPERLLLSEREIERLVQQRFPLDTRALQVFELRVEAPRVRLIPERNRVGVRVDIGAGERLFASRWRAEMEFDAVLRFDPREQALRLADVRVGELKARESTAGAAVDERAGRDGREGRRAEVQPALPRIGALVAERLLEGLVIYTVPAERLERLRREGVAPAAVTVQRDGVEIRLAPVAAAASAPRR